MKKNQLKQFRLFIIGIGLIASFMIVFSCLVFNDSETSFTGLEIAFGHEFASLGPWASGEIAFNPLVLLAFFMPLLASMIMIFSNKLDLLATFIFILSVVLMFMIPEFTTTTVTILDIVNEVDVEWSYGTGLMIAGSLSILGALLSAFMMYKKQ